MLTSTAGCLGFGGKSEFEKELTTLRDAVKQYDGNPKKAMEDGYENVSGPAIPKMGFHFVNPAYTEDAIKNGFSIDKPQVLVYDSEWNLGATEYAAPTEALPPSQNLFSDGEADATENWTPHNASTHIFAMPDGEQNNPAELTFEELTEPTHWMEFSPPDESIEAGDEVTRTFAGSEEEETRVVDLVFSHPELSSLHAWVFADNPEGLFNPVNPEFGTDFPAFGEHAHE